MSAASGHVPIGLREKRRVVVEVPAKAEGAIIIELATVAPLHHEVEITPAGNACPITPTATVIFRALLPIIRG